jgi:hypothetical protein
MTKNYLLPNLFESKNASEFFAQFIEMNLSDKRFSQRSFATRIKWPSSYIPDVIKGRKKLTVSRAIQFGNFVKLGPIDFEKLIYLAIYDTTSETEGLERITALKTPENPIETDDKELVDIRIFLIFVCIHWLKGEATLEKLITLAAAKKIGVEELNSVLTLLLAKNMIEKNAAGRYSTRAEGILIYSGAALQDYKIWQDYADFQRQFFEKPTGPAAFGSNFVIIEKARFKDIADRMMAFRKWIVEISRVDALLPSEVETGMFQFDLNLTPVMSTEQMNEAKS